MNENIHRALSVEETAKFFNAAKKRERTFLNAFLIMLKSGVRVGELAALVSSDFDKQSGFIHIKKTVSRDEIGNYYISDNTKTKSGTRDTPLTDELFSIMKEQERFNRSVYGLEFNGTLFKSPEGELLREYSINREIKRICVDADIEVFTCHAFRNKFATRFIEQRPQDYKILSEILGHKDVASTLNLYTHVMTENKVKAMQEFNIKTSYQKRNMQNACAFSIS